MNLLVISGFRYFCEYHSLYLNTTISIHTNESRRVISSMASQNSKERMLMR